MVEHAALHPLELERVRDPQGDEGRPEQEEEGRDEARSEARRATGDARGSRGGLQGREDSAGDGPARRSAPLPDPRHLLHHERLAGIGEADRASGAEGRIRVDALVRHEVDRVDRGGERAVVVEQQRAGPVGVPSTARMRFTARSVTGTAGGAPPSEASMPISGSTSTTSSPAAAASSDSGVEARARSERMSITTSTPRRPARSRSAASPSGEEDPPSQSPSQVIAPRSSPRRAAVNDGPAGDRRARAPRAGGGEGGHGEGEGERGGAASRCHGRRICAIGRPNGLASCAVRGDHRDAAGGGRSRGRANSRRPGREPRPPSPPPRRPRARRGPAPCPRRRPASTASTQRPPKARASAGSAPRPRDGVARHRPGPAGRLRGAAHLRSNSLLRPPHPPRATGALHRRVREPLEYDRAAFVRTRRGRTRRGARARL